jgi:hypothetical protein
MPIEIPTLNMASPSHALGNAHHLHEGEKDWEQDKLLQWAQQMSALLDTINTATNEAEGNLALCV